VRRAMATERADPSPPWGEFELIDKLFAPLARGFPGAFALRDDVAVLPPKPGHELVLKTDSLIESVHFLSDDPADTVAQKALRRALSDLAAKGAEPHAYLLAIALPGAIERSWLEKFAEGLLSDQNEFAIALAGGETNRTPGPLTITITALGWIPAGRLVRREGAKPGDAVWVTGTIGDACGGLALLKGEEACADQSASDYLVARYRLPEPRLALGKSLRNFASAAIDVSDGLIADLGHIAEVSQVRIEIDSVAVPLSAELGALWGGEKEKTLRAVSGGDDYEIAFTAPLSAAPEIDAESRSLSLPVTRIGRVVEGTGTALLDSSGREIPLSRRGYTHF
jgi:thiamine-monophosphate kinase